VSPTLSRARIATLVLGILAASLTLAACGEEDRATTTAATEAPTEPTAAEPTALRRRFEVQIREALERQGARVDSDCVIEHLRDVLSNRIVEASLDALEAGEEIPQQAVDAAFDAGSDCARGPSPHR
jgi:hypothetical protein